MRRPLNLAVAMTLTFISYTPAFAHDGHNLGPTPPRLPVYQSEHYRSQPVQQLRNDLPAGGCSTGSCCSGSTGCSISADGHTTPSGDLARSSAAQSGSVDIVRLAARLSTAMNTEMRGTRYYSDLMDDAAAVLRMSRRLRDAEAGRTPSDQLIDDARTMIAPLRRISRELRDNRAAANSYRLAQNLSQTLVTWARDVRRQPAVGVVGERPSFGRGDSIGPQPSSLPSRDPRVSIPEEMKGVALLPVNEQAAALRQRTCPVTRQPLGSMGKPIRVTVGRDSIYVCCEGCVNAVKNNPGQYQSSPVPNARTSPTGRTDFRRSPVSSNRPARVVAIPPEMKGVALLSVSEQQEALNQRTCPVTKQPLGSMGKPIRVNVADRSVFVCCAECVSTVKSNPAKYL